MTWLIGALSVLVALSGAAAEEVLREIRWTAAATPPGAAVLPGDATAGYDRLRVENAGSAPLRRPVLVVTDPGIRGFPYALTGTVRHEGVVGQGFLELWSVFPDGARYFSRTLGTGPLQALHGSADWRRFVLPFSADATTPRPVRLELNVVLPGAGVVELGPLRLVQYAPGEDPLAVAGAWWSDRAGGLAGGLGGVVLGTAGAVAGWLAARGRARGLVLGLARVVTALGLVAVLAGAVAWLRDQPYGVYYPLLLGGALGAGIFGAMLGSLERRYAEVELRRMRAADTR